MRIDRTVHDISEEISSRISEASLGRAEWSAVCSGFTAAFPGSFAALLNQNFARPEVSFGRVDGLDEQYLHSFISHYSYVNPWRRFWEFAPNGAICVSERDDPAEKYKDSVFYNEWLCSTGDYDASIGLRLQVEDDYVIYLPVHFSDRLSGAYERKLEAVMVNTRRSLTNAMQIASYLRDSCDSAVTRSALVDRTNAIAFVVDNRSRLLDANQQAVNSFGHEGPVQYRQGIVRFAKPEMSIWLAKVLFETPHDFASKKIMSVEEKQWLISINQLPITTPSSLLRGRQQFLIQVIDLGAPNSGFDGDLLAQTYKLTSTEIRLCRTLAGGLLLAEAAKCTGISYENARQKLKSIFRKTGVFSQSELKLLLTLLT